jgi:uncharacterized DUF497 family protein
MFLKLPALLQRPLPLPIVICTICAYTKIMGFQWDAEKAEANFRKHGVRFAESLPVFEDDYAMIIDDDSDPHERRFVALGMGAKGRVLVVVYTYRGADVRIISARVAEPHERRQYESER